MNIRVIAIVMLYLAGFGLGIAGLVFLAESGFSYVEDDRARRLMTNSYVLLGIGSAFFITASVLAFIAGAQRTPQDGEGKK